MSRTRFCALVVISALSALACKRDARGSRSLTLKRLGKDVGSLALEPSADGAAPREVRTFDPYYDAPKRFRALALAPLLAQGFAEPVEKLRAHSFLLRASDGYSVPIDGDVLLDGRAYVALDDLDVPGFAPIGPRQVSPAPAYLIWQGDDRRDLLHYPRPWQLVAVELVDPLALHPHTFPVGEAKDSAAVAGYRVFRGHCIRCHAINREGGSVGPDLNVPQSIVEYRPEAQIRAYIRDPKSFRYGAMPAHPELEEGDLDGLIAYFRAMSTRKHDDAQKGAP